MIRKIAKPFISHGRSSKVASELWSQQEGWSNGSGGREKLMCTLMSTWCNLQEQKLSNRGKEMKQTNNRIKLHEYYTVTS